MSVRDHLIQAGRDVDPPEIPDWFEYLLEWYWRISNRSGFNELGVLPIKPTEILAFFTLYDIRPSPWEIRALEEMDDAALAAR